jgi:hypothetical protein
MLSEDHVALIVTDSETIMIRNIHGPIIAVTARDANGSLCNDRSIVALANRLPAKLSDVHHKFSYPSHLRVID